jgi:two-component system CheB/CheR fusion protein
VSITVFNSLSPKEGAPPMLRVLVVDDCLDTATNLHWLLQAWGHEARFAANGVTALKTAENFQPDVVLLDIDLPGMDGCEVAKRLRQLDPQKPILIAFSGYCTEDDVRRALHAGCNYHLAKPSEPDEIKQLLQVYEQLLMRQPEP